MSFTPKTWTDRLSEFPARRTLTKADGTTEVVTVARNEGTVTTEGDMFNATNMNNLENRISAATNLAITPFNLPVFSTQFELSSVVANRLDNQHIASITGIFHPLTAISLSSGGLQICNVVILPLGTSTAFYGITNCKDIGVCISASSSNNAAFHIFSCKTASTIQLTTSDYIWFSIMYICI